MTLIQILILAIIQGLTEFLPVSSSAHLILGDRLFGWADQGLVFDVATHLGTLLAVLVYFRRELYVLALSWLRPAPTAEDRMHRRLGLGVAIGSLPVLAIGWLAADWIEESLRSVRVIAWATLSFGLLLWLADGLGRSARALKDVRLPDAVMIGLVQVLALIPGASRSGVTITMGRALGFSPEAAARFSFLLAIPVLAGAGGYGALRVAHGDATVDWAVFGLATVFAAAAGWLCIAFFLGLLHRFGLRPFILYRLALALVLFWIAY